MHNPAAPYVLRAPQAGDMGWVVRQHGLVYAREHGYDWTFEGLVASVVARFVDNFDPDRERCWIAEKDGETVGSVFCFHESPAVAKLRMLIVAADARGLGIGARLVDECVRFARGAGYESMTLWTHSQLVAARRLYAAAGFRLTRSEPVYSFGKDLVDEFWDLDL
jgi:GNAT superfamily N-acetyltransferase